MTAEAVAKGMAETEDLTVLEAEMLAAHARDDHDRLVELYRRAAQIRERQGDIEAACFYFTHAYVFALEIGSELAPQLHEKLAFYGREPLQAFHAF